jgi:hypothetical protein
MALTALIGWIVVTVGTVGGIAAVAWLVVRIRANMESAEEPETGPSKHGLVDVEIADGTVRISPRGGWVPLSLHTHVAIPLDHVESCMTHAYAKDDAQVARLMGSNVPGCLYAGTMTGPEGSSFWVYRDGANAIVLILEQEQYAYVCIEVDDPESVVGQINAAKARA